MIWCMKTYIIAYVKTHTHKKLQILFHLICIFSSHRPSDACMRQQTRPSLIQIMARRLVGAEPLTGPTLFEYRRAHYLPPMSLLKFWINIFRWFYRIVKLRLYKHDWYVFHQTICIMTWHLCIQVGQFVESPFQAVWLVNANHTTRVEGNRSYGCIITASAIICVRTGMPGGDRGTKTDQDGYL